MKLIRATVIVVGILVGALAAVQLVMFGVMAVALTGGPGCWLAPHPDHFVQQVWVAANPESDCGTRYGMVDDLVANHIHRGMTRGEVTALLGQPDDPDYGYMLGCWIDCDWLTVEYDANDLVQEAYRSQD